MKASFMYWPGWWGKPSVLISRTNGLKPCYKMQGRIVWDRGYFGTVCISIYAVGWKPSHYVLQVSQVLPPKRTVSKDMLHTEAFSKPSGNMVTLLVTGAKLGILRKWARRFLLGAKKVAEAGDEAFCPAPREPTNTM